MKKKITLKRIFHRDEWRLAVIFEYNAQLTALIKTIKGKMWSQTKTCWHVPDNEEILKQVLIIFREKADIDISSIVSGEKEDLSSGVTTSIEHKEKEVMQVPVPEKQKLHKEVIPPVKKVTKQSEFDPVRFTISEPDGRLAIKFTGKYDPEWIDELKTYGKIWYDAVHREWLLSWSQLAVDSLPDYFSSRGVEVRVKKLEVTEKLKETRQEKGSGVRNHVLGKNAQKGIELVRKHLEEKRYSIRTIESYLAHLDLFFKYFYDKDPSDINEDDIAVFMEEYILRLGYSASYQNLIISAIKMYFSLSGMRRLSSDSFIRPRRSRALPKVFSKEEVMKLFSVTRNDKHKLILWLVYSCGLRRSEVINIKLTDLDTDRGVLHIREGKGNADRMVPVPQKVWEKIRHYINSYKPESYLFEGQSGSRYSVESVYSVFKQSLRRAGIKKDVGIHCLRHSYATHLHESGLDIRYIQELLGHKSTRTTEIYTHISRRNLFAIRSPIEDMDIE